VKIKKMKKNILSSIIIGILFSNTPKLNAQVTIENHYANETSALIGNFQNINFREGGFSGLHYIPNTNGTEFWTVSDRGVNIDAANANGSAIPSTKYPTCKPTYDKIYAFPTYAPKIHRIKIVGNQLEIVETISLKRPNGSDASGLLNPTGLGSSVTEVISTNIVSDCALFDANTTTKDIWGIDSEGIDVDKDGNFWICEEGGPTIWKVSPTGIVLKRYTPYTSNLQPEDIIIDECFAFRRNNRGFEGITVTPNGKIYAIIQSPLYYKAVAGSPGSGTLTSSQIHRILEINPVTNTTKMYAYVNEGTIGTIKPKDIKIGDLKAINNTNFLVIEQASSSTNTADSFKKIYTIDITNASLVQNGLAYSSGTKTLEELNTSAALSTNSIVPVSKTLLFDMYSKGWPATLDKVEGLAIIDKNTLAITNDNDYGQFSPLEDGNATTNNIKSEIYIFKLAGSDVLVNYVPNTNAVLSTIDYAFMNDRIKIYPNPSQDFIGIQNVPIALKYTFYDILGTSILTGSINSNDYKVDLTSFSKGIYLLKIENKTFKIVKG
jgi:hypothetical protein